MTSAWRPYLLEVFAQTSQGTLINHSKVITSSISSWHSCLFYFSPQHSTLSNIVYIFACIYYLPTLSKCYPKQGQRVPTPILFTINPMLRNYLQQDKHITKSKWNRPFSLVPYVVPCKCSKLYQHVAPSFHKNKLAAERITFNFVVLTFHILSVIFLLLHHLLVIIIWIISKINFKFFSFSK